MTPTPPRPGPDDARETDLVGLVLPRPTAPGTAECDAHQAAFEEPWEIRAVGVVAGLVEEGLFTWAEFQAALIGAIAEWEREHEATGAPWSYYACWQVALEGIVVGRGALGADELEVRTEEFLSGARTPPHTHGGGLLASFPAEEG